MYTHTHISNNLHAQQHVSAFEVSNSMQFFMHRYIFFLNLATLVKYNIMQLDVYIVFAIRYLFSMFATIGERSC